MKFPPQKRKGYIMGAGKVMTDAQKMKFHADIYYMSANLLMEEKETVHKKITALNYRIKLTEEERGKLFLTLPAHCLYAFCSELYLKSLILESGNIYNKIHYLDDLYNALTPTLQAEIETEYSKVYEGNLSEMLTAHRKDFQDIRYACEGIGGARLLSFVKWLADILDMVTDKHVEKFERD